MRFPVVISARAEADLTIQYQWYLSEVDIGCAERYFTVFDHSVLRISEFPSIGRVRRFQSKELHGMRSFAVGNPFGAHLIFYRFDDETVSIERVMHGARDLPRRLLDPPGSD